MPTPRRASADPSQTEAAAAVRVLKKYPNRRLYDTQTSSYITLADVKQMVLSGQAFEVRDAKSAQDLTRSILLQIILEEESGGVPMFSSQTLAQIIRLYGHSMQGMMGSMLEKNMGAFAQMQKQFLEHSAGLVEGKHLSPELWTQFLSAQPTAMQDLVGNYLAQGRSMMEKMQEAGSFFPGMAGFTAGKK